MTEINKKYVTHYLGKMGAIEDRIVTSLKGKAKELETIELKPHNPSG